MDSRTVKNFQSVANKVRNEDWDYLTILDGPERTGKSNAGLQIQLILDPDLARAVDCADYGKVLSRVAWDFESMVGIVSSLPPGSADMYDESGLLGRNASSKLNRRMVRVMTTIGLKNCAHVWVFPSFHMLDPYLRYHRARTRGYVHTMRGERGYITWYARVVSAWAWSEDDSQLWHEMYTGTYGDIKVYSPNHA